MKVVIKSENNVQAQFLGYRTYKEESQVYMYINLIMKFQKLQESKFFGISKSFMILESPTINCIII